MNAIDQYTRFLCPKCGSPGFDSWNKAMFDGVIHDPNELPNPWIMGDNCQTCMWPAVTYYSIPGEAPLAVFGPHLHCFAYESEAMSLISADPSLGEPLLPSSDRDADWSRGCLHAKFSGSAL